jgi:dihydrofolate reductase
MYAASSSVVTRRRGTCTSVVVNHEDQTLTDGESHLGRSDPAIVVNSITSALERIPWNSAKIFLIGGAWLFEEALTRDLVDRIIITRILDPAYDDCDAFLPDFHSIRELDPALWRRASHAELCGHVGFQVEPGVVEEDGVRHEHEMWIKV